LVPSCTDLTHDYVLIGGAKRLWQKRTHFQTRVARWFIFKPKNPNLGGPGMENVGIFMTIWNILRPFGKFYGNLVQFVVICGIFFPFWYIWT
jgi:hypothetical protein